MYVLNLSLCLLNDFSGLIKYLIEDANENIEIIKSITRAPINNILDKFSTTVILSWNFLKIGWENDAVKKTYKK